MNQSTSPRIAVLRGGDKHHAESISSGYGVLGALQALPDTEVVDIYIDEDGLWHNKGVLTDPHQVFSNIDGYIDTTYIKNGIHRSLAKRMGIKKLFSEHELGIYDDREAIYRILRQSGIPVPESRLIRLKSLNSPNYLMEVWKSLHPPYLVRSVAYSHRFPSKFIRSYDEFKEAAKFYAEKEIDFHVVTYRGGQTISAALLPNYRGSKVYISIPVVSLLDKDEVPNELTKVVLYRPGGKGAGAEADDMKKTLTEVFESLGGGEPLLVDLIKTKRGFMVVEVKSKPSLRDGGRFMESLRTTGTELGHFLLTRI